MKALPLILLAPSEDKASGGVVGRLRETPDQRWVRDRLVALVRTGAPEALKKAFGVKDLALAKARSEALARYTGVAFQALDAATLPPATWSLSLIHI